MIAIALFAVVLLVFNSNIVIGPLPLSSKTSMLLLTLLLAVVVSVAVGVDVGSCC